MGAVHFLTLALIVSGTITFGLCIYLSRYRYVLGVSLFRALMLAATVWAWAYALELSQPTLSGKVFWRNVQQFGIMLAPVIWWNLALEYAGPRTWAQGKRRLYWFSVPVAAILLVWTNDFHHLMRLDLKIVEIDSVNHMVFERTTLSRVAVAYGLALLVATVAVLVRGIRQRSPHRPQLAVLLVSLLLPTLANLAHTLGFNPLYPLGPTALFFTPAGLLIAWGLGRYQLFAVWPVARDLVIETMSNGILVTNVNRQIVDLNPSTQKLLSLGLRPATEPIKWRPVTEVLAQWPEWVAAYDRLEQERTDLQLTVTQGEQHFLLELKPLYDSRQSMIGSLAVLHDHTEHRRKEVALLRLATIDQLTGIPNRRHFFALSEQIFELAERHGLEMSVVMVDVDRFKVINDTYGHQSGDRVLAEIGALFRQRVRRADVVGRLGGEEFAFTLAAADLDAAKLMAQQLLAAINELRVDDGTGQELRITASMGIATLGRGDRNFSQVLARADRAMYLAKNRRNAIRTEDDLSGPAARGVDLGKA